MGNRTNEEKKEKNTTDMKHHIIAQDKRKTRLKMKENILKNRPGVDFVCFS